MILRYRFQEPENVLYSEEYYVATFLKLIGDVGGNLGLFIGFCFADAVSYVLSLLEKSILFFAEKCKYFITKNFALCRQATDYFLHLISKVIEKRYSRNY